MTTHYQKSVSVTRKQQGYAAIFFIFFIAAVALGVYSMYDSGWTASERIRLQNTADNTTYSTVSMLSRDMNMMAITNRGMIANQVMIGQMVGLSSWSNYLAQLTGNVKTFATLANLIPYVGQVIYRLSVVVDQVVSSASQVINQTAKVVIATQNKVNGIISELQRGYHIATYAMIPDVYLKVLKDNDPDAEIGTIGGMYNVHEYLNLLTTEFERNETHRPRGTHVTHVPVRGPSGKQARENARIAQFGKLVNDSRDKFTADRSSKYGKYVAPVIPPLRGSMDGRGGTDFVPTVVRGETQWEWTSLDAMSLNFGTYVLDLSGGEWKDIELPLGWGAAHARPYRTRPSYQYSRNSGSTLTTHTNSHYDVKANTSRYWRDAFADGDHSTRKAARLAGTKDRNNNLGNIVGIRPFYDFRSDDARNSLDTLTLVFSKSADNFRMRRNMADDLNGGYVGDVLNVDEKGSVPANTLYALASANVSFERPKDLPLAGSATPWAIDWGRRDDLHEYGNLYNPFWEPKLAETDAKLLRIIIGTFAK